MNTEQKQALWQKIQTQLHPTKPPTAMPEDQVDAHFWYVRVMLGFAAWIAALFLLVFAFASLEFILDKPFATAILAALIFAAAHRLLSLESEFAVQFGLALSMAGQAIMLYSLRDIHKDHPLAAYLILFVLELALLYLANFISRLVCTCAAWVALGFALYEIQLLFALPGLSALGVVLWHRCELSHIRHANLLTPVGLGLLFTLMLSPSLMHRPEASWFIEPIFTSYLLRLGVLLPMLWVIWQQSKNQALSISSPAGLAVLLATILFALLAWQIPGLSVAGLLFLMGFGSGKRSLMVFGVACFAWYMGRFYYDLEMTLQEKSGILFISGLGLLLARFTLQKLFPMEQNHA